MYKKLSTVFTITILSIGIAHAQITIQSPYSKFGLGNLKGSLLPQYKAMGGISTGIQRSNFFNNINMQNPATYANISLSTIDIGLGTSFKMIDNGKISENNFNASFGHIAMAFPITLKSALSFGIMPYSELGYDFSSKSSIGTGDQAKKTTYLYKGEGGLSKVYLGYGIQFGDHFRVGANAEYLFGNLIQSRASEMPDDQGTSINLKNQEKNSVNGISFTYGLQYDIKIARKTSLVLGYSGSSQSHLKSKTSNYITQYFNDVTGSEDVAIDTLVATENVPTGLRLPLLHNFGFSIQKENKWLFGADFRAGQWSELTIANVKQNLQNTYGVSVGGQYTPDITAIGGYFKRVDYRLGFSYDKTYVQINQQDIKNMAITFGMGLPLSSYTRNTFYKANVAVELGKRGSSAKGLLAERYINLNIGFTINDKWFQRFKFD